MNNHQLINHFTHYPNHPIYRIPVGPASARWLTFTAQPPNIAHVPWSAVRQLVLDALYKDWQNYRDANIDTHMAPGA